MRVQKLLDLARIDVLATPDNHVSGTPRDVDVPLGIHDGQIAGVKPAIRVDRLAGRFAISVVALHDQVAPRAQFSLLSSRHNRSAHRIDNLYFSVGQGPPYTGDATF